MNINELVVSEWVSAALEDFGCADAQDVLGFTKSKLAEMVFEVA